MYSQCVNWTTPKKKKILNSTIQNRIILFQVIINATIKLPTLLINNSTKQPLIHHKKDDNGH